MKLSHSTLLYLKLGWIGEYWGGVNFQNEKSLSLTDMKLLPRVLPLKNSFTHSLLQQVATFLSVLIIVLQ